MHDLFVYFLTAFTFVFLRIFIIKKFKFDSSKSTGDCIGHLNLLKSLYENNGKIIDLKQYLFDTNDYPNGFHKLIYWLRIPLNRIEKIGVFIPSIFDFLLLLLLLLSVTFFGGDFKYWVLTFPFLLIFIHNNGRSFHFGERAMGTFFGSAYLFCIISYLMSYNYWYIGVACFCFVVFSTSSKFSIQAVFLISLILSIISLDYSPLLILMFCFIAACFLTAGYPYKVVKGLIRHSTYFSKRMHITNYSHSSYFDLFSKLLSFRPKKIANLYYFNPVCLIFSGVAVTPIFIYNIFFEEVIPSSMYWLVMMGLSGILVTLLISLKPFKILGEPERYLEYVVIPIVLVLTYIPFKPSLIVLISMGFLLLSFLLKIYFLFNLKVANSQEFYNDQDHLIKYVNTMDNKTLLCIDLRLSFLLGYYNNKVKFVTLFGNIGIGKQDAFTELVPEKYPYPGDDLSKYIKKHNIDYICVSHQSLRNVADIMKYDFSKFTKVFDNGSFSVYEIGVL